MRVTAKYVLWLLPLLAVGCGHKAAPDQTQVLAPPIIDTPPPKPAPVTPADLPPPVVGPVPSETPKDTTPPPAPPKKPVRKPKKPAGTTTTPPTGTTPAATTPAAPATTPPDTATASAGSGVSAIGELSAGDSGDLRSKTQDQIQSTEKGVSAITRPLTDTELKTVAQIREFLKQAKEALETGDVDGAHTLAAKAKVLLVELTP
jgi:hypothetical protein